MFRGCTRPAMFMGVPYMPFFIGTGACLLLSMYINLFYLALAPVVVFVMRQMARRDEMIFRLLGLRLHFRTRVLHRGLQAGAWAFSANSHRRDLPARLPR